MDIGGWQGRIIELDPDGQLMLIAFDSITLHRMDEDYTDRCEEEGLSWAEYYIGYDDVTLVETRDTAADVEKAAAELAAQAG